MNRQIRVICVCKDLFQFHNCLFCGEDFLIEKYPPRPFQKTNEIRNSIILGNIIKQYTQLPKIIISLEVQFLELPYSYGKFSLKCLFYKCFTIETFFCGNDLVELRLSPGMTWSKYGAAVLVRFDGSVVCVDLSGNLYDLFFVKADTGSEYGTICNCFG